eukprot:PhM_4_TR3776/c0_g2_i1/m.54615
MSRAFVPAGAQELQTHLSEIRKVAMDHYNETAADLPPRDDTTTLSLASESFLFGAPRSVHHDTLRRLIGQVVHAAEVSPSRDSVLSFLFCALCEASGLSTLSPSTPQYWASVFQAEVVLYLLVSINADAEVTRMWLEYPNRWSYPWMAVQMFRCRLLPLSLLMDDVMNEGVACTVMPYLLAQEDVARCYSANYIGSGAVHIVPPQQPHQSFNAHTPTGSNSAGGTPVPMVMMPNTANLNSSSCSNAVAFSVTPQHVRPSSSQSHTPVIMPNGSTVVLQQPKPIVV